MNIYRKIGTYLFILAAILVILSGVFPFSTGMDAFARVFLIFSGVLVGLINIAEEEEVGFCVASGVFLISIWILSIVLNTNTLMPQLDTLFTYIMLFVGSIAAVVALRIIVEFASMHPSQTVEEEIKENAKALSLLEESKALRTWNFIIFLAVCVLFITILLSVFFDVSQWEDVLFALDVIISVLFIVDLVVLYKKYAKFSTFCKRCWPDIIAAVPASNLFRVAKVFRLARLMKIMSRGSKLTKITKAGKSIKFFSQDSGFNHYLKKPKKRKKK